MHLVEARPVSSVDLVHALEILVSPVFGALSVAHQLGGYPTDPWRILETFTPRQIVDEIIARDLSLDAALCACTKVLVFDSPVFHMILEYDPRPRCGLCGRRHYVDKNNGDPLSCGDTARFRNGPTWRWTRAAREAAVEA